MNKQPVPLYQMIFIGMILGMLVGLILKEEAVPLGEIGKVIIQLIKALAGPLLFFAIIDVLMRTTIQVRQAGWLILITATNAVLALIIGLAISNILRPGDYLKVEVPAVTTESVGQKIDFIQVILGFIPHSIVEPFVENSIIPIIIVAILGGLALWRVKDEQLRAGRKDYEPAEMAMATIYRAIELALTWIIKLIPLAVFAVVAMTVGENGLASFKGLAVYIGAVLLGLAIHIGIVYQAWLIAVSPIGLRRFWKGARDPIVYALGTSSSLATLPVTLKSLDGMGVSPQSARLATCIGTNLNNDGILLYEALAVLFVAQVYGIDLSIGQQLIAAACCVIAGIGIAGVPEAGLISLSLVLTTVGLPIEILPLLLTVDWILSRARATTNVISDMLVATLLDRFILSSDSPALKPELVEADV